MAPLGDCANLHHCTRRERYLSPLVPSLIVSPFFSSRGHTTSHFRMDRPLIGSTASHPHLRYSSSSSVQLILYHAGGTGFSPRDITPESIRPLLHREAPAIAQSLINEGLKHTPLAVLSRPVVGTRHQTLICTLPGRSSYSSHPSSPALSVKAIRENLAALKPLLPRIINLMSSGQCSGNDSQHNH